jgi:hypothetical protein
MDKFIRVLVLFTSLSLLVYHSGCVESPAGDCVKPSDCEGRMHILCDGGWSCVEEKCNWVCLSKPVEPFMSTTVKTTTTTVKTSVPSTTLPGVEVAYKNAFSGYYSPILLNISPRVPGYVLPLTGDSIVNYAKVKSKLDFMSSEEGLLKNGFTVIENPFNPREEDITLMYKQLKDLDVPVFITTDSLLHLYHIQFDETLRIIEERQFYDLAWNISERLLAENLKGYGSSNGELKEAYRRNTAFLSVALELLKPREGQYCADRRDWQCMMSGDKFMDGEQDRYKFTVLAEITKDVEAELKLIEAHAGFSPSPIFKYDEDYSQYLPRGHYTRSEKLKNYFKALMWYGRMSFILKGCPDCIVSEEDARIQTLQASIIASQLDEDQRIRSMWDRIYGVTAFYVGFSDDLGPYDYNEALDKVFASGFTTLKYNNDAYGSLKAELAAYRSPKIYGGTGGCTIDPPFTPGQADECLEDTKGFRLMGQRFIPDSYMFSELVFPYTGGYTGSGSAFTACSTPAGVVRCFPRGLDVMALLGSKRAWSLLDELEDSSYTNYTQVYGRLEGEFNSFTVGDWNQNLYWSWLYALKPLLGEYGDGYPTFMQSTVWQEKGLNTALASWAELRHDTILYAKQSYTMKATSVGPMPVEKPVVGYVEPVPEFYARLLTLTRMTNKGLDGMKVLDETSKRRLVNLEEILERLLNISQRELENEELSQEDYDFIKDFGDELNGVIAEVDEKAKKTTVIADVHTDGNTNMVLEEGVGYVEMMVVAYKVPDGRIILGAGPVFSYYEFKHPMSDRLTDEKWRDILEKSPPEKPEWVS